MAFIKTENLSFSYPKSNKKALKNINIEVEKGEFVLLMGESGSGKSTLLRLLKKEISPFGRVGGNIFTKSKSIAFVGQNPDTSFISETVRGELVFALENKAMSNAQIAVRLGETASFFNIDDLLDSKLSTLSGGTKSAVSIASAIIDDADTIILDEPFAQLDPKAVLSVAAMLKRINEELGVTVIMSSHISAPVINFCDRLIVLKNGESIFSGSVEKALEKDELLDFFPVYTKIFEERPISIKSAKSLNKNLKEKPLIKSEITKPAVELKNICFAYSKNENDILNRLSYTAYQGKINSVIGSNGSGKTTLLKVIAKIQKAYSGKVKTYSRVAYLPQNVKTLFTKDSVGKEIKKETAELFGISDCIDNHPFDLSGGQAQKLALGILYEQDADIFLLDEPTKAFDFKSKEELKKLLFDFCSHNKTIIIVSHDLDFVGDVSDFVSFLSDGIISKAGDRRAVLSSLKFYTTSVRRITASKLENAVSAEDLI